MEDAQSKRVGVFRRHRARGVVVLLLLVGLTVVLTRDSDKERIQTMFQELCELGSVSGPEHPLVRLEKAQKLEGYFAESVSIHSELFGQSRTFDDRDEFKKTVVAGRSYLSTLEVSLGDLEFQIDGESAEVTATLSALGAMPGAEGKFFEQHRIKIGLIDSGRWKIRSVEHLENLRE